MTGNRVLAIVEGFVGVTAVGGGVALAAAPDGGYLQLPRALLEGSPFSDYLVPGLLLATFVGAGGLLAAAAAWRRARFWQPLGLTYAFGLILFVAVEYVLIGFNWLQAFEAVLGAAMVALVAASPRVQTTAGVAR